MISQSILRIIDYNTADNDEKTLVVSVLQLNEGEKLHQLLALISCTEGVKRFCEEHNVQLDDELIPRLFHVFFRDIVDTDYRETQEQP